MVFRRLMVLLCLLAVGHSQIATDQAIVFLTSGKYNGNFASSNPCQSELLMSSALSAYHTSHTVFPLVADATHDMGDLLPGINDVIGADGTVYSKNWADTITLNFLPYILTDREGNDLPSQTFWSGADMSNGGVYVATSSCKDFTSSHPNDNGRLTEDDVDAAGVAACDSTQNVMCAITHLPPPPIVSPAATPVTPRIVRGIGGNNSPVFTRHTSHA
jgi:hypothetical protein